MEGRRVVTIPTLRLGLTIGHGSRLPDFLRALQQPKTRPTLPYRLRERWGRAGEKDPRGAHFGGPTRQRRSLRKGPMNYTGISVTENALFCKPDGYGEVSALAL